MPLAHIQLKKGEDRRIRLGHPWIYSNEIDTKATPLKAFTAGDDVQVAAFDGTLLGRAYINPHSLISARLYTRDPKQVLNQAVIEQKLTTALSLRDLLFAKPYYRLIFGEADGLPGVVVDRFGQHVVLQINTAGMEKHKDDLVAAIRQVLPDTQSILFRADSKIRLQEGLELYVTAAFGEPPETATLEENDVHFTLPLLRGQKTGWFFDHRMSRARLKQLVANKKVLDVFSYLGGWGIQAAAFGARSVDCIEVSAFACDFISQNAKTNNVADKVNVICDDAFDAMKNLIQQKKQYDVITLDPPAFVKKLKDRKEGIIAYQRLNEMALKLLAPNGILVSCSCSMQVNAEDLLIVVQRAAVKVNCEVQLIERGHQGPDHPIHPAIPETDYLKALFVRKI